MGQIVNLTKQGIPFPDLNIGFLNKQWEYKNYSKHLIGVPKLSNPATL